MANVELRESRFAIGVRRLPEFGWPSTRMLTPGSCVVAQRLTIVSSRMKADPSFKGADVRIGARVVPGSIRRQPSGREYAFRITDGSDTLSVVYKGIAPDTFTDSADVVVAGFATDGTFQAGTLLAKCASRYENAPPKYQNTAGYKASKKA